MQVQGRHRRPSGACMDASTPHVIEVQTRRGQRPREPLTQTVGSAALVFAIVYCLLMPAPAKRTRSRKAPKDTPVGTSQFLCSIAGTERLAWAVGASDIAARRLLGAVLIEEELTGYLCCGI